MSTAALIGGSIAGATISSAAAGGAAKTQANAAQSAAQLQYQSAQNALDFQKQQYNTEQQQIAPWLAAGTGAINKLAGETVPSFQAPTAEQAAQTPGYQFQLAQGQKALEGSAAARGNLLSGSTAKAIDQYSQGLAASNYQQTYNNALTGYNTNTLGAYNRLSALAGVGQQAQATGAQQGQAAASNLANINLVSGQQQGNAALQQGAATASGYAAQGNIWGNAVGGIGNTIQQQMMLSQLANPRPDQITSSGGLTWYGYPGQGG